MNPGGCFIPGPCCLHRGRGPTPVPTPGHARWPPCSSLPPVLSRVWVQVAVTRCCLAPQGSACAATTPRARHVSCLPGFLQQPSQARPTTASPAPALDNRPARPSQTAEKWCVPTARRAKKVSAWGPCLCQSSRVSPGSTDEEGLAEGEVGLTFGNPESHRSLIAQGRGLLAVSTEAYPGGSLEIVVSSPAPSHDLG